MRWYLTARRAVVTTGAAIALSAAPAAAARPPLVTVTCGQTLTHSVRLARDVSGCPGDGLVIGADGVTVNLNGHAIVGAGSPAACDSSPDASTRVGVRIVDGHDNATIENGAIRQFDVGLQANGSSGMTLHGLMLDHNPFGAVRLLADTEPATSNTIEHNGVSGAECDAALLLVQAHADLVRDNRVTGSAFGVILCCGGDHNLIADNIVSGIQHDAVIVCCNDSYNTIRENVVTDNHESGIDVCCDGDPDKHDIVADNIVARNAHQGILLEGASANVIRGNKVFANGDDISVTGDRNTISDNRATDTLGCPDQEGCGGGIEIDSGAGNIVAGNRIARTLRDGIRIAQIVPEAPPNVDTVVRDNAISDATLDGIAVGVEGAGGVTGLLLDGNTAVHSGDDGIDVRTVSTTLTENFAAHNVDFGIDAVAGVTDGGGNRAFANGNPLQCTSVFCAGG